MPLPLNPQFICRGVRYPAEFVINYGTRTYITPWATPYWNDETRNRRYLSGNLHAGDRIIYSAPPWFQPIYTTNTFTDESVVPDLSISWRGQTIIGHKHGVGVVVKCSFYHSMLRYLQGKFPSGYGNVSGIFQWRKPRMSIDSVILGLRFPYGKIAATPANKLIQALRLAAYVNALQQNREPTGDEYENLGVDPTQPIDIEIDMDNDTYIRFIREFAEYNTEQRVEGVHHAP